MQAGAGVAAIEEGSATTPAPRRRSGRQVLVEPGGKQPIDAGA
jgi:hypothetical protein